MAKKDLIIVPAHFADRHVGWIDRSCSNVGRADRCELVTLRESLEQNQREAQRRLFVDRQTIQPLVDRLNEELRRIKDTCPRKKGWPVLGAGLKRVYRSGRRGFATALQIPSTEEPEI
jgi:hypothetical protein